MKLISSRDNPLYKSLSALAADARESRKQGRTLIDGPHLVSAYRRTVGLPEMLVVSESGQDDGEVQVLIQAHAGIELVLLRDSLFREVSGLVSPVGIIAVIPIPLQEAAFTGGSCVLLDAVQDAGNLGSILRTTAAAGIRDVFLGPGCSGAWSPRVMRAAQGAHFSLSIRERVELTSVLRAYSGISLATVVAGGVPISSMDCSGDVAWLFGSEGRGVDAALVGLASHAITIPLANDTESLNVAAAAAICLFKTRIA